MLSRLVGLGIMMQNTSKFGIVYTFYGLTESGHI